MQSLIFVSVVKPFKQGFHTWIAVVNELGVLVENIIMFPFFEYSSPNEVYLRFGMLYMAIFLVILVLNLVLIIYKVIQNIVKSLTHESEGKRRMVLGSRRRGTDRRRAICLRTHSD